MARKFNLHGKQVDEATFRAATAQAKRNAGEVPFRSEETLGATMEGKDTAKKAAIIPGKGTFFGLNKEDIEMLTKQQELKKLLPLSELRQREAAAQRVGERSQEGIESFQGDTPSAEEAQQAGLGQIGIGLAGGAGLGLIAKGVGGAAAAAVPLAGAAFLQGAISNLKKQTDEIIQADTQVLTDNKKNLKQAVNIVNKGGDSMDMMEAFNNQLSRIDASYSHIQAVSQTDLSGFLGKKGIPELMKYEDFYAPGGQRELLVLAMQQAILNPDPSKQLQVEEIITEGGEE